MNTSVKPDPRAVKVDISREMLIVDLADGRRIETPLEWFPSLLKATAKQRANWRLIGDGIGIRWESIDEDLSIEGLLVPERAFRRARAA